MPALNDAAHPVVVAVVLAVRVVGVVPAKLRLPVVPAKLRLPVARVKPRRPLVGLWVGLRAGPLAGRRDFDAKAFVFGAVDLPARSLRHRVHRSNQQPHAA